MREIKFRFWSKVLNHFVMPDDDIFVGALKDENMIVMQYTGLKDKNGKEIYEGDIVRVEQEYNHPDGRVFRVGRYEVKELMGTFGIFSLAGWWTLSDFPVEVLPNHNHIEKVEVVGNVYENPELL